MPCLPTSHLKGSSMGVKLTKRLTATLRCYTSWSCTGSKRSSSRADIRAYFPRILLNFCPEKVPMQPRSESFAPLVQVTKMGYSGSDYPAGYDGRTFFIYPWDRASNWCNRVSKQWAAKWCIQGYPPPLNFYSSVYKLSIIKIILIEQLYSLK